MRSHTGLELWNLDYRSNALPTELSCRHCHTSLFLMRFVSILHPGRLRDLFSLFHAYNRGPHLHTGHQYRRIWFFYSATMRPRHPIEWAQYWEKLSLKISLINVFNFMKQCKLAWCLVSDKQLHRYIYNYYTGEYVYPRWLLLLLLHTCFTQYTYHPNVLYEKEIQRTNPRPRRVWVIGEKLWGK